MPLPTDWVDALFLRLTVAYGDRFLAQWPGQRPEAVKAFWAAELDGITSGGIAHALKNLPGAFPVNAMQFRDLCRSRPMPAAPPAKAIAGPPADPLRVRRALEAAGRIRPKDPRAWAAVLEEREQRGERLTQAQRTMWRAASRSRMHEASNGAASSGEPEDFPADPTVSADPLEALP